MNNFSSYSEKKGFDWPVLISGILMVVASLFVFRHPGKGLRAFILIFAILSIVQGIVWLAIYSHFHQEMAYSWIMIVAGVLDIIIGILFMYSYDAAGITLAYLFAIWFIFDSIAGISFSWQLRKISTVYFIFSLVLGIFSLLISISLLFNPYLSALTMVWLIGFWLLIFGVNQLVSAIARR